MKKTIAAFDFDKTITDKDLLIPFSIYMNGKAKTALYILLTLPHAALFGLGKFSRQRVKEYFLSWALKGNDPVKAGNDFVKEIIPKHLKKEALERIEWHRAQNHILILISANLEFIIEPWGKAQSFNHVICTKFIKPYSGKILGKNCWGVEKVKRMIELFGPLDQYELYVYGDGEGDLPLLKAADHPYFRSFSKEGL